MPAGRAEYELRTQPLQTIKVRKEELGDGKSFSWWVQWRPRN